jgi:hypothetical protein
LLAGCLAAAGSARIIEDELTLFFNNLKLDLQGAEFSFMSLNILPGSGWVGLWGLLQLQHTLERVNFAISS